MKTIISHPDFDYIASQIEVENPDKIQKAKLIFEKFKDWWPNIKIENVEDIIENMEVYYIASMGKIESLFENIALIQAITRYFAKKVHVIIPFFPVGTMERVSEEWEIATAKTLARILSSTPMGQEWITTFHTFDIHDERIRFYTSDDISFKLHNAIDLLKQNISKDTIIVFPDEWAKKRFGKNFLDFEKVYCSKERIWEKREIRIVWDVNLKDRKILIVDDLIQSWSTIIECAKVLKKVWASKISAYATHWVFVDDSIDKMTQVLDELITTDTIPQNNNYDWKIKILKIKDLILDKIMKI